MNTSGPGNFVSYNRGSFQLGWFVFVDDHLGLVRFKRVFVITEFYMNICSLFVFWLSCFILANTWSIFSRVDRNPASIFIFEWFWSLNFSCFFFSLLIKSQIFILICLPNSYFDDVLMEKLDILLLICGSHYQIFPQICNAEPHP